MKIGLVTDSTCDLKSSILDKYQIEVIPLTIHFGDEVFQDGVDIKAEEFYSRLTTEDKLPHTSQPAVGVFLNKYQEMASQYDAIISLHLSGQLSGTVESAMLAAKEIDSLLIKVIDTSSVSLGLGFLVRLTAQLIKEDYALDDIIKIIEEGKNNLSVYFTVNDLTYLEKGGRIGKAQAFLGSIFNFNPLLEINPDSGIVSPIEKVRGNTKTMKKIHSLALNQLKGADYCWVGVLYGDMEEEAIRLKEMVEKSLDEDGFISYVVDTGKLSPTLGCHGGPSIYGIVVLKGDFLKV